MPSHSQNRKYSNGRIIVAAAGSGKTTYIVEEALKKHKTLDPYKRILITTFTDKNEEEIRKKIIKKHGCIPQNIIVQTWFSFLLQHGVRPYQDTLFPILSDERVKGISLVNQQSAKGIKEGDLFYYFTKDFRIYTDKLSKFVCKTIEKEKKEDGNLTPGRIKNIFPKIYIDEMQDLAGYDLDFVELLIEEGVEITLVGDPKQRTYLTNYGGKNKTEKDGRQSAMEFFKGKIEIDKTTLNGSWRNCQEICDFANRIHDGKFKACKSKAEQSSDFDSKKYDEHHGIWIVNEEYVSKYCKKYTPNILRHNKKIKIDLCHNESDIFNFGLSKGLTFDRVLIYPTEGIKKWLKNPSSSYKEKAENKCDRSACAFYVAVTRARYSVAFVCDKKWINEIFSAPSLFQSEQPYKLFEI